MRQISILYCLLSEDLLFRLKPVIKRALMDTSFVILEGSCGDLFVERYRHRRCGRIWCRSTGGFLARRLRFGRLIQFDWLLQCHEFFPLSSTTNQISASRPRLSVERCPAGSEATEAAQRGMSRWLLQLRAHFLLPLVGLRLRRRAVRLLVIADDTFQWASRECRTFLAADYERDGTERHLKSPSLRTYRG